MVTPPGEPETAPPPAEEPPAEGTEPGEEYAGEEYAEEEYVEDDSVELQDKIEELEARLSLAEQSRKSPFPVK
ncbi:MAG TPA: hypothetical protein VKZ63_22420, partial [Kofleriaceae bacterium]|nr:hypothetical protein [Kofleriaceae bacterium]